MSTCLVTGGAGFIGSHLVEALMARGERVRVLDNLSSGKLANLGPALDRLEFLGGDIQDEAMVQQAMAGVETVFHLAAMVSVPQSMARPRQAEMINTVGTVTLLQAARAAGVRRLVFSSTCAIYGDEPTLPKTETMAPCPKSPYAISKLTAEQYCRLFSEAFGLETAVLRYFNVYGPRQDPSSPYSGVISIFVDKMSQGQPVTIFGDGDQTRDFVFVSDVVQANLLAAAGPAAAGRLFNIGTGRAVTVNQLFASLSRILGYPGQPVYQAPRPGDVRHSYADAGYARTVLNWQPQVDFETGLARLAASLLS
ncbi:MAG: SDR family oxidoreductase [Chloroflexota bacterium]